MDTAFWHVVARQVLGLVFLTAGTAKLRSGHELRASMMAMGIRSSLLIRTGSAVLPWVEIAAGLGLILRLMPRELAWLTGAMLAGFTLLLAVNLASGKEFACHCFGSASGGNTTWWTVARNLALMALAAAAALASAPLSLQPILDLTALLTAGGVLLVGLLGAAFGSLFRAQPRDLS